MKKLIIYSVSDFLKLISDFQFQFSDERYPAHFIYRGERNSDWKLIPAVFRKFSEPQKAKTVWQSSISGKIYRSSEDEILSHFIKESSSYLPNIAQEDFLKWLLYAQHFGVPTRLLDFTDNPLVALYFCCHEQYDHEGSITIIQCENFFRWSATESPESIKITRNDSIDQIVRYQIINKDSSGAYQKLRPVLFYPPYIDTRMSAQSSKFLIWGADKNPLEEMISSENHLDLSLKGVNLGEMGSERFYAKIYVDQYAKIQIMNELRLLNISEKTLFPGLDGIGRYIERYYRRNPDEECALM